MKTRVVTAYTACALTVLAAVICSSGAKPVPTVADAPPSIVETVGRRGPAEQGEPGNGSTQEQAPDVPMVRNMPFYAPGHAPSADQEFAPIPFEDLLPHRPGLDDELQPTRKYVDTGVE